MEATSLYSSTFTGCKFPTKLSGKQEPRRPKNIIYAIREDDSDGKVVDENMIVLRTRIKDMKMMSQNVAPSSWMEWEKRYYQDYTEDVCEAVGLLQMCLMNTRPCLALGIMLLVAFSVPVSAWVVIVNAMGIIKRLI